MTTLCITGSAVSAGVPFDAATMRPPRVFTFFITARSMHSLCFSLQPGLGQCGPVSTRQIFLTRYASENAPACPGCVWHCHRFKFRAIEALVIFIRRMKLLVIPTFVTDAGRLSKFLSALFVHSDFPCVMTARVGASLDMLRTTLRHQCVFHKQPPTHSAGDVQSTLAA